MTIANDAQHADVTDGGRVHPPSPEIIIGVHGVGSPSVGVLARDISEGYANAHPHDEITTDSSTLSIPVGAETHLYQCIRVRRSSDTIHIWEVNWSDLKGLPSGSIGSVFYALKTLIAMIQISDKGWDTESRGVTGPLITGFILRRYFYLISLVAPPGFLLIAYAYIQSNIMVAYAIIVASTVLLATVIYWLKSVDRLIGFSALFLLANAIISIWMLIFSSSAQLLLRLSIQATGILEGILVALVLGCLVELVVRFVSERRAISKNNITVFASRGGMIILAVSLAAGAYGALVNAVGFYILQRLFHWHLANPSAFATLQSLYLQYIGYDLAQMELINATITFGVGLFLLGGISYQLVRINISPNTSMEQRGRHVQDCVNVFLWLTFAGFFFVLLSIVADVAHFFRSPDCAPHTLCSIYGIQWLLSSPKSTTILNPIDIYAASAARIIPFLLPAVIPPLRAILNVAPDVLLYILPPSFPLSFQKKAQERFKALLTHLQTQHPNTNISVLAHSQGTVIASDVLAKDTRRIRRLVTVGSPLGSLYRRFLGRSIVALPGCEWMNIYRLSDYIAGPISNTADEDHILKTNYRSAHFKYFEDGGVIKLLLGS
jgi:hypothetical protein